MCNLFVETVERDGEQKRVRPHHLTHQPSTFGD